MIDYDFIMIMLLYILVYSGIFKCKLKVVLKFLIISTILGIVVSLLFIIFNVYLYVDYYMFINIIIYIIMTMINSRYLCFAYVYPLYYSLIEILNLDIYSNVEGYIFLIAVLHLIEGILLFIYNFNDNNVNKNSQNFFNCVDMCYEQNVFYSKKNVIRNISYISIVWIVPILVPIVTNYQLYEIIKLYNIKVIDILKLNNGHGKSMFFSILTFFITYQSISKIKEIYLSNSISKNNIKLENTYENEKIDLKYKDNILIKENKNSKIETKEHRSNILNNTNKHSMLLFLYSIMLFTMFLLLKNNIDVIYIALFTMVVMHDFIYTLK